LRAFATLTPDALAYMGHKTVKTRSNAYPVPGWYDKLAEGLQVFDAGACGTIPVPPLNPTWVTNAQTAIDAQKAAPTGPVKPTPLQAMLPNINNIIYGGDNTAPLPAPDCSQQPTLSFQGQSNMYPHVNEDATP
jgi:hypothetical protein